MLPDPSCVIKIPRYSKGLTLSKSRKDMLKIKEAGAALSWQSSRSAAQFGLALSLSPESDSFFFCLSFGQRAYIHRSHMRLIRDWGMEGSGGGGFKCCTIWPFSVSWKWLLLHLSFSCSWCLTSTEATYSLFGMWDGSWHAAQFGLALSPESDYFIFSFFLSRCSTSTEATHSLVTQLLGPECL